MDTALTRAERDRAFERFESVISVHSAAIDAFELVASRPDAAEWLAASVRVNRGMKPNLTQKDFEDHAESILETLERERSRNYEIIRGSALIAVCGAFEYLVKASFVDQAAGNPERATSLLTKAKLKLSASDVLSKSTTEQWFVIADRLFEQLADAYPFERVQKFLLDFMFMDGSIGLAEAFARVDLKQFNKAFLVRNCLVHNGGRVSTQLARATDLRTGDTIALPRGALGPMLKQIREIANVLSSQLPML